MMNNGNRMRGRTRCKINIHKEEKRREIEEGGRRERKRERVTHI